MLGADQRSHARVAIEPRAEPNGLRAFDQCLDDARIDGAFDQDAARGGADLALIDEDAEQRVRQQGTAGQIELGELDADGIRPRAQERSSPARCANAQRRPGAAARRDRESGPGGSEHRRGKAAGLNATTAAATVT